MTEVVKIRVVLSEIDLLLCFVQVPACLEKWTSPNVKKTKEIHASVSAMNSDSSVNKPMTAREDAARKFAAIANNKGKKSSE